MKQFQHTVTIPGGIHARTTGRLVSLAARPDCRVNGVFGNRIANLSRPIELLALNVRHGDTVTVLADGPDEDACIQALQEHMKESV